jgi:hypothetical protein
VAKHARRKTFERPNDVYVTVSALYLAIKPVRTACWWTRVKIQPAAMT